MLARDEREPAWLRDYGYTDFGAIEADVTAMEEFAKKLRADVESHYVPHLARVTDAMLTELPAPATTFPELVDFMRLHQTVQDATHVNVYSFANGTNTFATAAEEISHDYEGSDAFANARVRDVRDAFVTAVTPSPEKGAADA